MALFQDVRSRTTNASLLALLAVLGLAAGCASIPEPPPPEHLAESARDCMSWFHALDQAVDREGVRDASAHRIAGFPYLRVDRFSASFRSAASSGAPAFDAWVERLLELDRAARRYESSNLPAGALASTEIGGKADVDQRVAEWGARLVRDDLSNEARRSALIAQAIVPDDYAQWTRATGVYAVASIPFSMGVDGWHKEAEEMFRKAASEERGPNLRRYDPAGAGVGPGRIREILRHAKVDALGVPRIPESDVETLFRSCDSSSSKVIRCSSYAGSIMNI